MTRTAWPSMPRGGKDIAVLFKVAGDEPGKQLRKTLRAPESCLLQFAPKGSYRLQHTPEYYRWLLPNRAPEEPPCVVLLD
eukprot:2842727-Alexandrium_andersonii.AAC.1